MKEKIRRLMLKPARVLVLGIAGIILIGAFLLNLPMASNDGQSIGFINSLFTATSAVSVTGLVVVNTAEHWTLFGKVVIILLIQAGGLGFMTLATLIAFALGKRISLKERLIMQEQLNQFSLSGIVKLTRYVIISTLIIEGIGALLLSTRFIPIYGLKKGIWFSIFHAISAFCNAGFDIIGNSIVPFVGDPIINLTICGLIILGGLGYTVYIDLTRNRSIKKSTLHTKVVLLITTLLIVIPFLFIFIVEYNNPKTLQSLSDGEKVLASFFQAVVPRTAGFNSIDVSGMTSASIFLVIIMMFIGGSPSSTAGGIKTTTFGVIILSVISVLKGNQDVEVYKKRIPNTLIFRALAVMSVGLLLVVSVTMALTLTENKPFLDLLYEVTSAFATVGLTRGVTPDLSLIGKILIILTMFTGKVGPLTLAFALASRQKECKGKYRYPEGKIMIG
ncbi:Ktr system potassium uptake protein B [Gottschalkia purinilytica]|uniref:Ktr system potassium uptake protein B n=1 Tax=Gottschalkia purinilytica TaxID=1503 RepID=A0A0L0W7S4_GOTPU|nr:TrkH family potassium uptake protein [Gottschalkia purinilytica]KNF07486.1 Ktr system potassium uptake protein B [Gottschalkia purinilytica]